MSVRVNVLFPDEVIEDLRSLIPEGKRSEFVAEATRERILRERQRRALLQSAGSWNDEGHGSQAVTIEEYLAETRLSDAEREARLEALRGSD
jgi:hypothetical protein